MPLSTSPAAGAFGASGGMLGSAAGELGTGIGLATTFGGVTLPAMVEMPMPMVVVGGIAPFSGGPSTGTCTPAMGVPPMTFAAIR